MLLKNKNLIFIIRRSKVTDYAALNSAPSLVWSYNYGNLGLSLILVLRYLSHHVQFLYLNTDKSPKMLGFRLIFGH